MDIKYLRWVNTLSGGDRGEKMKIRLGFHINQTEREGAWMKRVRTCAEGERGRWRGCEERKGDGARGGRGPEASRQMSNHSLTSSQRCLPLTLRDKRRVSIWKLLSLYGRSILSDKMSQAGDLSRFNKMAKGAWWMSSLYCGNVYLSDLYQQGRSHGWDTKCYNNIQAYTAATATAAAPSDGIIIEVMGQQGEGIWRQ